MLRNAKSMAVQIFMNLLHLHTMSMAVSAAGDVATSLNLHRASIYFAGNFLSWVQSSTSQCLDSVSGLSLKEAYEAWKLLRAKVAAPALWAAAVVCLVMSVMLVMEAIFMSFVSLGVKILRRKPEDRYKSEDIGRGDDDLELGSLAYPKVLVQIPMYNEREVYKLSIGAACALTWPPDRILIQVLDDSTNPVIKELVKLECSIWASKGTNIVYEVRDNRKGYKAGALKKGMEHTYAQQCEYVAIFDADFQPESDFLIRTMPFLVHNPEIALVQARWDFVNYDKCLMTRIQKMSLDYHFKVEQESGSATFGFFGFNGTAGVWRISAINEAGGWKDRTTVEDMDLAVRASLDGWKFLYVGGIKVKSELPSTFKAYCQQQHRWTCGAANLFRKMACDVIKAKKVSIWMKIHLIYSFFFVRRAVAPLVTFFFYCIVIPVSVLIPEVTIPKWGVVYIPTSITILNAIRNPSSLHILPFWILFENVMAMHRMRAALNGLLETANYNEWIVTKKLGEIRKENNEMNGSEPTQARIIDRISFSQLWFSVFLILCASYNAVFGNDYYFVYIYLQAFAFIVMGFGYVGTFPSKFLTT